MTGFSALLEANRFLIEHAQDCCFYALLVSNRAIRTSVRIKDE